MVRSNYIIPNTKELAPIIELIENEKDLTKFDCYLYVLWRTATNMWGYQNESKRFYQYFI